MIQFNFEAGARNSNALEIIDYYYLALVFGAWTDDVTLEVHTSQEKDGTYVPLYTSAGTQVVIPAIANRVYGITGEFAEAISAASYIKLRTPTNVIGAGGATVNVIGR
jgi:hypothetical protein